MRVLVTGADGFVGRRLCRFLAEQKDDVLEVGGPSSDYPLKANVLDRVQLYELFEYARPDAVIHLAGFSSVGKSHADPATAFAVNAQGTIHLLTAIRDVCPKARVLLVGSGEMYGAVPFGERASEDHPLRPLSPYASAKAAAEIAGVQFFRSYSIEVISARPFNHLGPGQDPGFVVPTFAAQIAMISSGRAEPVVRVGNLEPIRDFSHVDDVVRAYRTLLTHGTPGTAYNVCSGTGRTIRSLLDEMLELAGVRAEVQVDPTRVRPVEIPSLVGNPQRIASLGWQPRLTVRDALRAVLERALGTSLPA